MQIYGLQKLTLLDYPDKIACTVFLNNCSFRCPFCHNFELVESSVEPIMTEEDFFAFLQSKRDKLDGVAITGGEPCLHVDLQEFIRHIRALGLLVKLDTNGYHPDVLQRILQNNLVDYVAMDIKNSETKYAETVGVKSLDFSRIERSIALIKQSGVDYEFRTTVVDEYHSFNDFVAIGMLVDGAEKFYLQPFVNRDTVYDKSLHSPSDDALELYKLALSTYVKQVFVRGR